MTYLRGAMGKQFSEAELGQVQMWKCQGVAPADIHDRLARARAPARDAGQHRAAQHIMARRGTHAEHNAAAL